jgi:tetratricopeptide (TPR) repeat protein
MEKPLMSFRLNLTLLLVSILNPLELEAAEYDYYSHNPRVQRGVQVILDYHWDRAVSAANNLRYRIGIDELGFILKWIPNHPQALLLLSNLTTSLDHAADAKPYFEKAIEFGPQYESSYTVYGIHLFKSGRFKDSIEKFNSALVINSESSEIHYNLGLAYFAIEDYEKAEIHAQHAYRLEYPLPGLKNKLKSIGRWVSSIAKPKSK